MAYTEKRMVAGVALTNALVTYYTVSASPMVLKGIVKEMVICNTSGSPVTFTINVIPLAGAAGVANTEFAGVTLQAYETKIFGRSDVLETGGFIQAMASTGGVVSLSISGVERT